MNFKFACILVCIQLSVWSAQGQLLWKVSSNDLKTSSFLFGTHHLIEKDCIPHFDSILSVCNKVEVVVGEMDLKTPGMQRKMMMHSVMKGKTIKELVSDSDYTLLDKEFKSLMGVGMSMLGTFKPMMLMSLHQLSLYMKSSGIRKQPVSVDELFQKLARESKKKVIGLESLEYQMKILFDSIPLKRQAEILLYEVREKDNILMDLGQLNDVYVSGDLDQMKEMDVEDDSMTPEERKMLVDDRNLNWIKRLPSLFKDHACFVAVGCLHLVGDTGLINQLRQKGFTVEPVLFK